jgi:hypothetical protein
MVIGALPSRPHIAWGVAFSGVLFLLRECDGRDWRHFKVKKIKAVIVAFFGL